MSISVCEIDEQSSFLQDVIELGGKNRDSLGFLPKGAYVEAARNRKLLVALTPEDRCVGYLLYRVARIKYKAVITHLCVDIMARQKGIGRTLVQTLVERTEDLIGISLYSRRDYKSNSFWPQVGFQYRSEKLGRGRDQIPLTYYWYDHNQPSLLNLAKEALLNSKDIKAVIDANVIVYLFEDSDHPLLAEWLLDDMALCVTSELFNEINRDDEDKRRKE